MSQPLVSIGLVTYMHAEYIEDCLESLICQTYQNIELLILDDASSDDTYSRIVSYEQRMRTRFPYLSITRNSHNSGNVSANLNKILKRAKGSYIKTFAGDDAMFPTYVEEIVDFLEEKENENAILAYTNAVIVGNDFHLGDDPGRKFAYWRHRPYRQTELYEGLLKQNHIVAASVMLRRRAYEQYGFYDETIKFEDYDLWLRLSRKEQFSYLPSKLIYYRRADTSITNYRSENGKAKLKFMMSEDKKVLKKNFDGLSKSKRRIYQQSYYESYLKEALYSGYWDIAIQICLFMKRRKYHIPASVPGMMINLIRSNIMTRLGGDDLA